MEGPSELSREQRTGGPRFVTEVCQQVARGLPSEVLISPSQFLFPFLARTRIDGAQQVVVMGVNTVTYTVGDIIRKILQHVWAEFQVQKTADRFENGLRVLNKVLVSNFHLLILAKHR